MANFYENGTYAPYGAPVLKRKIVTNSETVKVGNSFKLASGFLTAGTTGALVYGHAYGIVTSQGLGLTTTGAAGAAQGSYVGTYTVTSSNQTVAKVQIEANVSKYTIYSAEADATLGTTTGSNLAGYSMDLLDATELDESSALTTTGQYMSDGVDPAASTRVLVHIYESQVFGV